MTMCSAAGEILSRFPVRKTPAQKAAFRRWLAGELEGLGYAVSLEEGGRLVKSRSLVAGNPDRAAVVFTAHYDTCAQLPLPNFIAPRSLIVTLLLQLPLAVLIVVLAVALEVGVLLLTNNLLLGGAAVYAFLALCIWAMLAGKANPSNANDNTSGTAALLEIARALPPALRDRTALVWFDNEEKGLLGSRQFARRHGGAVRDTLLVNFDCVGDGDNLRFFPTRGLKGRQDLLEALERAFPGEGRKNTEVVRGFGMYPSDQIWFPLGAGVAALHKSPVLGEWMGRIHTRRDRVLEEENLRLLTAGALRLAAELAAGSKKSEN